MYKDIISRLGLTSTLEAEMNKYCIRCQNEAIILADLIHWQTIDKIKKHLAFKLGIQEPRRLKDFFTNDFISSVVTCEMLLNVLSSKEIIFFDKEGATKGIDSLIKSIKYSLSESIIDLGIIFDEESFKFIKKGEEIFDRFSLSETLLFLNDYPTAKKLFSNAISNFLQKEYQDAITKSYSALETVIKTYFNNDKTLENNIENILKHDLFTSYWKSIFVNYCKYAHEYSSRHGKNDTSKYEIDLKPVDIETYMYMTGILIRLFVNLKK